MRRRLVVRGTIATQAREGIDVSHEDAETSYFVVTEGQRAVFFDLKRFADSGAASDPRHRVFVENIRKPEKGIVFGATLRDFRLSEFAALTYAEIEILGELYRNSVELDKHYADVRGGMNSTESGRFVRAFWEPAPNSARKWVKYCKGGNYSRFYSDVALVLDWTNNGHELKTLIKHRYGSESRFIKSPEFYFKKGITWTEKSSLGFSARILEEGAIFNVAGPCAFPRRLKDLFYLLGILDSSPVAYTARAISGRNFGSNYIARMPIPPAPSSVQTEIASASESAYKLKRAWDTGNETSSIFETPWLLNPAISAEITLSARLDAVLSTEQRSTLILQDIHKSLDKAVSGLFGLSTEQHEEILMHLGSWPKETIWPQMEGNDTDQKRREHVDRLLCYLVRRVVEAEEEGIVCLQRVAHQPTLIERVRHELAANFPSQDPSTVETEVVNEIKKKTRGYHRTESLGEWLHDAFFEFHNDLYQQRPILWHLASSQARNEPGFSCVVHAHRFDADALAKIRSVHIRDRITTLRREAAQAGQDGKESDRIDLLLLAEEVEAYDVKLKLLQEGAHSGSEGGEHDFRILTPWKKPIDRPRGWQPDLDDGIKVNLGPLARTDLLRKHFRLTETKEED